MSNDFTAAFITDQSAEAVYAAINDVRGWWAGDLVGPTTDIGDEFTYRYEDIHCSTQRITELVPERRVVWRVVDSHLSFANPETEWTGTDIVFDISRTENATQVRLTHVGLTPEFDCFEACSGGWRFHFVEGLRRRVEAQTARHE